MAGSLTGRTALITGATRGIGLDIALRLAREGARVCITGRRQPGLDEALAQFPSGSAIGVQGAADDPEHREEVFRIIAAEFGALDIFVGNAGINPAFGPLMQLDLTVARKTMEVNVVSTLAWTQGAVAAGLGRNREGNVVLLSSVTGDRVSPGIGWYGVTKAAVSHLTRTLAVELAPGVRVNAVAPAVVKTRFAAALYEGREAEVAAGYPLGRLGTVQDVSTAVAFLVSDEASWITGQVLTLDGGLITAGGVA